MHRDLVVLVALDQLVGSSRAGVADVDAVALATDS